MASTLTCADYHVAWVCAVADLELLPARLMLDEEHPTPQYNTHYDENTYVCGSINRHAVVIATCPQGETGNVNAGRLTGSMFKTFPNIRMALLVGIGGGIPRPVISDDPLKNIHLGDVVVGWPGDAKSACVYHDRGTAKVNGRFETVGTMQNPDWRLISALGVLAVDYELGKTAFEDQLARLQHPKMKNKFAHPGLQYDQLFKNTYHHTNNSLLDCTACNKLEIVERPQRTQDDQHTFVFHPGRIATGNAVIRDGELRDQIGARCDGALCVEMEAAGVDSNRRCLVIRGISDYADSHKNDVWRFYAAGKAAAFARELICRIQPATVKEMEGVPPEAPWLVPLPRPRSFVGREAQISQILTHVSSEGGHRLAVYGLGGCGKTALALETAYQTRESHPTRAVFWVPAFSKKSFEQAFQEIGTLLRIPDIADINADVKRLVKKKLSDESFGSWLIIVDNADDESVLFDASDSISNQLIDYLPFSRKGSVIFTTRTRKAAINLSSNLIPLSELNEKDAKNLLKQRLPDESLLGRDDAVHEFLEYLTYLPLAIVQAVAFMVGNNINLSEYIAIYKSSETEAIELLSRDFEDQGRYRHTKNPVATTWYISFNQIQKQNDMAAKFLYLMACTAGKDIPASLIWSEPATLANLEALGTLTAYAFVTENQQPPHETGARHGERLFNVHRLVCLATRNWLEEQGRLRAFMFEMTKRLVRAMPAYRPFLPKPPLWSVYLPHARYNVIQFEGYEVDGRPLPLGRLVVCSSVLGRYEITELACQQILDQENKTSEIESPVLLGYMRMLADAKKELGKIKESENIYRHVLVATEKRLGKKHPDTLLSMWHLGNILVFQQKFQEAEEIHRKILILKTELLGKESLDALNSMLALADVLMRARKLTEAEYMYQDILLLTKKMLGEEHETTLSAMSKLGDILRKQRKYVEAERVLQVLLRLQKKVLGEDDLNTVYTVYTITALAWALASLTRLHTAFDLILQARLKLETSLGREHPLFEDFLEDFMLLEQKLAKHHQETEEALDWDIEVTGDGLVTTMRGRDAVTATPNSEDLYQWTYRLYSHTKHYILGLHQATTFAYHHITRILTQRAADPENENEQDSHVTL